ncbi:uncharacterized mitochondrial protein-like protein [Tanacetum coccineum]
MRKKLKEVWFTICHENGIYQDLLNTYESSDDDINVVDAPREPFVVKQDPDENFSQRPSQINHNCCYECEDSLDDIFCQRCTCKSCGKGAHYGYNVDHRNSDISKSGTMLQSKPNESYKIFAKFRTTMSIDFYNSNLSGFDQFQPPQFPVNYPPQETSKEILQAQDDLMEAIQAFLKEYDHTPPNKKCMALLLAEERFLKIKQAMKEEQNQPGVMQELLLKLMDDLQIFKGKARDNFLKDVCTFLRKFSRIPFGATPKVILIAWERFGKIKDALTDKQYQQEDIQELMSKLLEDVRNIREELSEYINCPSWNRPSFYDNDDDEYTIIYSKPKAITPDLLIEEPDNSLSMGDEHIDTIPSVENLVPIPSEFKGIFDDTCDMPVCENPSTFDALNDHSEILSDSNNDGTSSDDDSYENIEYVEASPFTLETVSLEEVNKDQEEKEFDLEDIFQIQDVILREKLVNINRLIANIEFLKDNPTPDRVLKSPSLVPISITDSDSFFEKSNTSFSFLDNSFSDNSFSNHTEETRSGSTTTHANNSFPEYDSFLFEGEPDQGGLTSVVISDNSNNPLLELPEFESFHFDLYDDPSFPRPPLEPPDVEISLIVEPDVLVINNVDEFNEDECFDPGGGMDIAKITRKRSKPDKHGHEMEKSEVIENGNSWIPIPVTASETVHQQDRDAIVPSTAEETICKKNDEHTRSKDNRNWNQGSSSKAVKIEDASEKAMCAIDGAGFDWSDMAEEEIQANMALRHSIFCLKNSNNLSPANHVKEVEPKKVRENNDAPIIEDWVSDDEDEVEPIPKVEKKTVIPTATKKEFVKPEKPVRRSVSFDHIEYSCLKTSHPSAHKHMAPRAVLMKTGLKSVNTARPVNTVRSVNTGRPFSTARSFNTVRPSYTAHPKSTVHCARPRTYFQNQAQSTVHMPFYKRTTLTKRSYYQNVNTGRQRFNTGRQNVNTVRARGFNVVKPSACWVWRPIKPNGASLVFNKYYNYDYARSIIQNYWKDKQGVSESSTSSQQDQDCIVMPIWKDASYFVNNATPEDLVGPSHASEDTQVEDQEIEIGNIPQSSAVPTTPQHRNSQKHPIIIEEPKRVSKALSNPAWVEAMQEELLQFKLQKVWILVDLPKGHRAIGTKMRHKNIPVFMLHRDLWSTKWMSKVLSCMVVKALYGLHQAPRAWYDTLANYLLCNGFQRGKIDQTLFIKRQQGHILLVQIYVDDIIFGSTKKELRDEFEKLMNDKFQMSLVEELTFFLVSDLEKPLVQDGDAADVDEHLYRSMIGSLMYLTASMPDIMFAVCACARFQVSPKTSHLLAVKRIFRYLKGKPSLGLWYPKDSPLELVAYTDSDYAGATQDRKSTTRGC